MPVTQAAPDDQQPGERAAVLGPMAAREQDAFWLRTYRRERYYRPGLDYEDYAPAYCVGYTGFAQYGGRYEDAEKSLCANWERIKGDSRLPMDEALQAIRAAWNRMAGQRQERTARPWWARLLQRCFALTPPKFNARLLR